METKPKSKEQILTCEADGCLAGQIIRRLSGTGKIIFMFANIITGPYPEPDKAT
jgi:hypothetical protein